jgi:hypothetical protein
MAMGIEYIHNGRSGIYYKLTLHIVPGGAVETTVSDEEIDLEESLGLFLFLGLIFLLLIAWRLVELTGTTLYRLLVEALTEEPI